MVERTGLALREEVADTLLPKDSCRTREAGRRTMRSVLGWPRRRCGVVGVSGIVLLVLDEVADEELSEISCRSKDAGRWRTSSLLG